VNKEWHRLHPMPPKATRQQRIEWHVDHAKACACRSVAESLKHDVEKLLKTSADIKNRRNSNK
jgi:hypothetical protein